MKKNILLASGLPLLLAFASCINHPKGGSSSGNILIYSESSITEADTNDGTFNATIEVTLKGSEFVSPLTADDYGAINLPEGLDVAVTRTSATKASISIAGQATSEEACGDGKAVFFFKSTAFSDDKLPISSELPITVVYIRPTLSYSVATLTEDVSNDGSISDTITVTAQAGGTFSTSGVLDASLYTWTDLPEGLTPVVTVNSATEATISFTDAATLSTPLQDIKASIQFSKEALSDNFCDIVPKKGFDIEFYRSVIMYALPTASAGSLGGRSGADLACEAAMPDLPEDYDGARAFLSTSTLDVVDLPNQTLGFDDSVEVEGAGTTPWIATNWADLFDGDDLIATLASADVIDATELFWSGSDEFGVAVTDTCANWTSGSGASNGQVGSADEVDENWLINGSAVEACDELHRVLCIAFVRN
jgi:hypothetical protein